MRLRNCGGNWLPALLATAPVLAAGCGAAGGDPAARVASIGTNPPGSVFYSVGAGLARLASDSGRIRMTVQPYSGSSTFSPLLNEAEIDFGVASAVEAALAYRGPGFQIAGRNPFPHAPNLRLVMRGSPLLVALLVRRDSPVRTVYDIRGTRLTGGYPAHLSVWYLLFGYLASAGLTWADVEIVPVPGVNDGIDALVQGRADVSAYALNGAKVREADATVGVRHVPLDCSPAGVARLRAAVPAYYTRTVEAGRATAVVEDTCVLAYDLYLLAGSATPTESVRDALEAIWAGVERLPAFHPVFQEWTRDRAVDPGVTVPYHTAAVAFYGSRGVWTPLMERAQQRLLAER